MRAWQWLALIVVVGAALLQKPWPTLSVAALVYAALIPLSIYSYAKVKRQRAAAASRAPAQEPAAPSL